MLKNFLGDGDGCIFKVKNKGKQKIRLDLPSLSTEGCEDEDKIFILVDGSPKGPFCSLGSREKRDVDNSTVVDGRGRPMRQWLPNPKPQPKPITQSKTTTLPKTTTQPETTTQKLKSQTKAPYDDYDDYIKAENATEESENKTIYRKYDDYDDYKKVLEEDDQTLVFVEVFEEESGDGSGNGSISKRFPIFR